jgi:stringent starvation protein B
MTQPGKKETLLAYLERGIAMLHLDARRKGVHVPDQHADDHHLRLNLSYRYGIPDLRVNDDDVVATLSFHGRGFQCVVPWSAIFGITSQSTGEGQVWPEDLPSEVMNTLAEGGNQGDEDQEEDLPSHRGAALAGQRPRKRGPAPRKKPALVAIDGDAPPQPKAEKEGKQEKRAPLASAPEAAAEDDKPAAPTAEAPRKSHLRLVR